MTWQDAFQVEVQGDVPGHGGLRRPKTLLQWATVFYVAHPSDLGKDKVVENMKPAGNRQQRNQPRLVYGVKATAKDVLKLAIAKSNDELASERRDRASRGDTREWPSPALSSRWRRRGRARPAAKAPR